jgi:hypothetical protein
MKLTPSPIVRERNPEQLPKALYPILVTLAGIATFCNEEQP